MSRTVGLAASLVCCAYANVLSIVLSVPAQAPMLVGSSFQVNYSVVVAEGDNITTLRFVPYFDGAQYGAEVGISRASSTSPNTFEGDAWLPLPWSAVPPQSLILAYQGAPGDGPTIGNPPPPDAILSNSVPLSVEPRNPSRPKLGDGTALLTVYFETWFTPLNFFWNSYEGGPHGAGVAEAIPSIGRYASVNLAAMRSQAAHFIQAGVDALVIDWTNK